MQIKAGTEAVTEDRDGMRSPSEASRVQLTIRSNHAMRLMMFCALNAGKVTPVSEVARACNMKPAHLAKIANALSGDGFIETVRGRHGGVRLTRPAAEIRVGAIVASTEVGAGFVECFDPATNTCPLIGACRFRTALDRALGAFIAALNDYTLADLVSDRDDLRRAMGLDQAPAR